jgi:glutathione S-transferase
MHYLNNSRSQRVLWLLEELGIEYEIKFSERDAKTMLAPESRRQVHRPVITNADLAIADSGAIQYSWVKYFFPLLASNSYETHSRLRP